MEPKQKTHKEVKEPQITVQALADYMSASERGKRSIVQSCRYRANARVIQHNEAKAVVSTFLRKGGDVAQLLARAAEIRNKLADSDFDADVNEHNADYVEQFAKAAELIALPKQTQEIQRGIDYPAQIINGVKVTMRANLVLRRTTKTNMLKVGALMLRYAKGKPLRAIVGANQAAAIFGFLRMMGDDQGADPDRALCLTLDAFSGSLYPAPGDAVDIWNDMKAACATIAERWPNIPKPTNAIL